MKLLTRRNSGRSASLWPSKSAWMAILDFESLYAKQTINLVSRRVCETLTRRDCKQVDEQECFQGVRDECKIDFRDNCVDDFRDVPESYTEDECVEEIVNVCEKAWIEQVRETSIALFEIISTWRVPDSRATTTRFGPTTHPHVATYPRPTANRCRRLVTSRRSSRNVTKCRSRAA